MSRAKRPLPLFEGLGVELEYMIVDRETLSVLPVADELLRVVAGKYVDEIEQGPLGWSNDNVDTPILCLPFYDLLNLVCNLFSP